MMIKQRLFSNGTARLGALLMAVVFVTALGVAGQVRVGKQPAAPSSKKPSTKPTSKPTRQRFQPSNPYISFVRVPAGTFTMGGEKYSDEKPAQSVRIGYSFEIGKYEVTQAQWKAVMGSNPSSFKGDDLPVESVSWNDCQTFLKKLTELMNDGYEYRLPSEAEWEYACRAGTNGDYAGNLDDMGWYDQNSQNRTHLVGKKDPNGFGLYDMHGNVWEWCEDNWHENYQGAPTNGSAWTWGGTTDRVRRGGSWLNIADGCRSASRYHYAPGITDYYVGFRVVRVPRT